MRRIYTSDDVLRLIKEGKTELPFDENDSLTDVARELVKRKKIKLISVKEKQSNQVVRQWDALSVPKVAELPVATSTEESRNTSLMVGKINAKDKTGIYYHENNKATYDMLLINGILVIPEFGELRANIAVKDGKIAAILTEDAEAKQVIDAKGLYILPGIIDPHTHIGLMAPLSTELETEGRSALLGGITTVGCFFNHEGSYLPTLDYIEEAVTAHSRVDFIPHLALRDEIQLAELPLYSNRGIKSYKMYMCGVPSVFPHQEDGFIFRAMQKLSALPIKPIICIHAENASLIEYAKGDASSHCCQTLEDWRKDHPDYAEEEAVLRAVYFGQKTGVSLYIVHVSSKEGINALKNVKTKNVKIETTSPYLTIDTSSSVGVYGKMLPAFRSPESREALWQAIEEGLVDTIGTDNVTMTMDEKGIDCGMEGAMPGYPALGTHLVSVLQEGVIKRGISMTQIVPLMTMNPAKIFGVYPKKGTLLPGSDADLVLVDLKEKKVVNPSLLESRSDFSLFQGQQLQGWPCATIKGGHIVAWNGKITDDVYRGTVLKRT